MTEVTGDSRLQSDVLEDLSDAFRYRRWLCDLARPYLDEHPVEIGSGTGDYALEWVNDVERFTATEADESRLAALTRRFADHRVIEVEHLLLAGEQVDGGSASTASGGEHPAVRDPAECAGSDNWSAPSGRHSAAVAFNVLEHIPDDVAALRSLTRLVRPGGAVVLVVPAFPSAMSQFDLAIGHQRRYTRASLAAALRAAGLDIEQLRYINPLGLLSWYVTVKALRMTPHNGPALRLYDRLMVPLARMADRAPMPFGQSVFAVGRVR